MTTSAARWSKRLLNWLKVLVKISFFASLLFTVTGFFGGTSFLLDLTSHFRVQYVVIQLLGLFWLLKTAKLTKPMPVILILLALGANGVQSWRYISSEPLHSELSGGTVLNILHMNVFVFNTNYAAVEKIISQNQADIVSLQEINRTWYSHLKQTNALRQYPYRIEHIKAGNLLLSRYPLLEPTIVHFSEPAMGKVVYRAEAGYITAKIRIGNRLISLINLHPPVPISPNYAASYQHYLNALAANKPKFANTIILVGDLNTTPWSYYYRQYLDILKLKDAKAHRYMPTWPTYLPVFAIPIDQVFVSPDVQTVAQRVGPFDGSDHLSVHIELLIPNR